MTCYNPKFARITKAYYWPNTKNDINSGPQPTRKLKFLNKFEITDEDEKQEDITPIPCRKCIGCLLDKASEWATRAFMEAKNWKNNCFITLTYDNKHLPKNRSLRKKDIQDFVKRLRYYYTGIEEREYKGKIEKPIRFFYCGEIGPKTHRPHYHMAIFNWKPDDLKYYSSNETNDTLFTSKKLEKIWDKGFVIIGNLTYESACYIARYTMKKIGKQFNDTLRKKVIEKLDQARLKKFEELEKLYSKNYDTLEDYVIDEKIRKIDQYTDNTINAIKKNMKEPEFIEVSRKGGIGIDYWKKHKDKIKEEMQILTQTKKGAKYKKIPEYIKNLWRKENPEEYIKKTEEKCKETRQQIAKIFEKTSLTRHAYRQLQLKQKLEQIKALKRLI